MVADSTWGKQSLLYPLDDPQKAWDNALQDQGYNVYAANPFTQSLQRAARGNRVAYLEDRTLTNGGAQPSSEPENYGNYIKQQISSGNAFNNLNEGYARLGTSVVPKIRDYQSQLAAGKINATNANPYLALLSDELSSGGGQGTADALSYLRSPMMGAGMARSYTSALGDVVGSSQRTLASDPATYAGGGKRDIWSYIFGSAGSPF